MDAGLICPFAVLRTAVLPLDALAALSGTLAAPSAQPSDLADALARDRAEAIRQMAALLAHPVVREALFLASPDLADAVPDWGSVPDAPRTQRALGRYLARMAGRSTPFGLFAGWGLLVPGESSRAAVSEIEAFERHSRLDMDYCWALCEGLSHIPELRQEILFRPNTSLFRIGGLLRFVRVTVKKGRARDYHLTQTTQTPFLALVLQEAASGAKLPDLAARLVAADEDGEVTHADALTYLGGLADAQILLPEILPPVTGPEPLAPLVAWLREVPAGHAAAAILTEVDRRLAALDQARLRGQDPGIYRAIAADLAPLPAKPEINRLIQVDLKDPGPPGGGRIGPDLVARVREGVEILRGITPRRTRDAFQEFRAAFERRYEGQEVPLLEALDEESGIGFQASSRPEAAFSPLLDGLAFPGTPGPSETPWGAREGHLLRRWMEVVAEGGTVLELTAEDLAALAEKTPAPYPPGMDVMVKVVAPPGGSRGLDDPANLIVLGGAGGPTCANLLGRFCHGDAQLTDFTRAALRHEESWRPDALYAEIVHLPEGRLGNVILRPLLREHEIPFLGRSGAPEDRQISLDDLRVSVRGGRVVLRSVRLDREIVPCLTNAHNFARGLGLYRFLSQLQGQGHQGFGWSWGPLDGAAFLPRVQHGRFVLAPAQWAVQKAELAAALAKDAAPIQVWEAMQAWRRARKLPRWVLLADGDNKLPIDLDSILSLDILVDQVKARAQFVLEEMLPEPGTSAVTGGRGQFAHELLVPLLAPPPDLLPGRIEAGDQATPRVFVPGLEWLYTKIYTGPGGVDRVLTDLVQPILDEARASLDGWFFIRYGDPDWHLRVRFRGKPALLQGLSARLIAGAETLRSQGVLWKIQTETYQREVERYGAGEAMERAEAIFEADSEAVLAILGLYPGDAGADARWRLALRGMDFLLDDLGMDMAAKRALVERQRASYKAEFNSHVGFERAMGERFRAERKSLEGLFADAAPGLEAGFGVLAACRECWRPHAARVAQLAGLPQVPPLADLAASYLHMNVNRALRSAQRAQELVLFDFLARILESQAARQTARPFSA